MPSHSLARRVLSFSTLAALAFAPAFALADTTHIVAKGHTIETIAHRYHVTIKAIVDANHLKDPKHLKPGEVLIIPGVHGTAHAATAHGTTHGQAAATGAPAATGHAQVAAASAVHAHDDAAPPTPAHGAHAAEARESIGGHTRYEMTPKQPDVVHALRLNEEFTIRVKDRRGKIPPPALGQFGRMMASGTAQHEIDPRLIALVGIVSNHFGGRKLEIVSGYRPFNSTQYTAHSNHNQGKALDFRVQGVPNEVLRDFCHTLRNVGVGYYPNSTFVHLDVRDAPATWTDYSRPGEPPRYDRPTPNADESSSEVPDEAPLARSAPAAIATTAPAETRSSLTPLPSAASPAH